ncbi:putative multi-domain containing protein [Aduncisulcus paluster]|uniref:Multi-domain containing protein n=1 Tax=Aduncisulcus paluster TaxID=2918883 RepID=A0ABQ5KXW4_9EUKA|nr:putative multi-domain containing protein [Aduncisulcus paluster]
MASHKSLQRKLKLAKAARINREVPRWVRQKKSMKGKSVHNTHRHHWLAAISQFITGKCNTVISDDIQGERTFIQVSIIIKGTKHEAVFTYNRVKSDISDFRLYRSVLPKKDSLVEDKFPDSTKYEIALYLLGFEFFDALTKLVSEDYESILFSHIKSISLSFSLNVHPGCGLGTSAGLGAVVSALAYSIRQKLESLPLFRNIPHIPEYTSFILNRTITFDNMIHRPASGVDAYAVVLGGLLVYHMGRTPSRLQSKSVSKELDKKDELLCFLIDTKEEKDTRLSVKLVRELIDKSPSFKEEVEKVAKKLTKVLAHPKEQIGGFIEENGLVLDQSVSTLEKAGVIGKNCLFLRKVLRKHVICVKLCGGGPGGFCLAFLWKPKEKEFLSILESYHFDAMKISLEIFYKHKNRPAATDDPFSLNSLLPLAEDNWQKVFISVEHCSLYAKESTSIEAELPMVKLYLTNQAAKDLQTRMTHKKHFSNGLIRDGKCGKDYSRCNDTSPVPATLAKRCIPEDG